MSNREFFTIHGRTIHFAPAGPDPKSRPFMFCTGPDQPSFDVRELIGYREIRDSIKTVELAAFHDELVRRTLEAHTVLNLLPEGLGIYGEDASFGPLAAFVEFRRWLSAIGRTGLAIPAPTLDDCLAILAAIVPDESPLANFPDLYVTFDEEELTSHEVYATARERDEAAVANVLANHRITPTTRITLGELAKRGHGKVVTTYEGVRAQDASFTQLQDAGACEHHNGYVHRTDLTLADLPIGAR